MNCLRIKLASVKFFAVRLIGRKKSGIVFKVNCRYHNGPTFSVPHCGHLIRQLSPSHRCS